LLVGLFLVGGVVPCCSLAVVERPLGFSNGANKVTETGCRL
jgi:hypothetical protein